MDLTGKLRDSAFAYYQYNRKFEELSRHKNLENDKRRDVELLKYASDKSLISRTTGGKHKYVMQDCNVLNEDRMGAFRRSLVEMLALPYEELCHYRRIGTYSLVREQMELVALAAELNPADAQDVWQYYGNESPELLPELDTEEFLDKAKRRERKVQ